MRRQRGGGSEEPCLHKQLFSWLADAVNDVSQQNKK